MAGAFLVTNKVSNNKSNFTYNCNFSIELNLERRLLPITSYSCHQLTAFAVLFLLPILYQINPPHCSLRDTDLLTLSGHASLINGERMPLYKEATCWHLVTHIQHIQLTNHKIKDRDYKPLASSHDLLLLCCIFLHSLPELQSLLVVTGRCDSNDQHQNNRNNAISIIQSLFPTMAFDATYHEDNEGGIFASIPEEGYVPTGSLTRVCVCAKSALVQEDVWRGWIEGFLQIYVHTMKLQQVPI